MNMTRESLLDYLRITLYIGLAVLGFFLYQAWENEHPALPFQSPVPSQTAVTPQAQALPTSVPPQTQPMASAVPPSLTTLVPPKAAVLPKGDQIKVDTDVLSFTIDTLGGDIVEAHLKKYPEALGSPSPFTLFNDLAGTRYIAESGLLSTMGPDTSQGQALYTTPQLSYTLKPDAKTLVVPLHWEKDGIQVNKVFTFERASYTVKVTHEIHNSSQTPWSGQLYAQLMRTDFQPPNHNNLINLATYFGAAISTPNKLFEKITFKQMKEKSLDVSSKDGWIAMIQHYFISAWVPPVNTSSTYYSKIGGQGLYTIGMIGTPLSVAPGQQAAIDTKLYAGPAVKNLLEQATPSLKLTIDYGWFWFISEIIFWLMQAIHDIVGNWGWSIVLVTIIIKLLFYQLSAKSYRSMNAMKKLQPRIESLKQRFGDDKQALTQATLALYRQEKINPMSGCLPILIQIPVFIALYWVLVESVELRQAPFIFWIHDLSQYDPYYILPVLMGLSMFVQQRLNPPPPDPVQAKVMMLMPVLFTVLFAHFPSGLMLYWFVNNTLSFLQQWYVMHRMGKA